MKKWGRKRRPSRGKLLDRKHQLEGEIRSLAADIERRRNRGAAVGELETRLVTLRSRHHQTRLRIDRTG